MELIPALRLGWLNGWIPLGLLYLVFGILMATFPKDVVKRLYDKSDRSPRPKVLRITGKTILPVFICLSPVIYPWKVKNLSQQLSS